MDNASASSGARAISRRVLATDVEMQQGRNGTSAQLDCHTDILTVLFGLSDKQLRQYPGAASYCRYLETCFEDLLAPEYAPLWGAIGKPTPKSAVECWGLVRAVCSTTPSLDDERTIDDVCSALLQPNRSREDARGPCVVAIFSVLCWTTMSLTPELRWTEFDRSTSRPSLMIRHRSISPNCIKIENVERPIPAIFRQFHRAMPTSRWRHRIGQARTTDTSAALEVSCLNYACLLDIAKIRLLWVDDLASHLDFDATKRTLSVFRFPTFCAMSILGQQEATRRISFAFMLQKGPIRELFDECAEVAAEAPYGCEQLHQEVLMSYRLLFCQTRCSRRLVRAALNRLRAVTKDQYDPLLDLVCARSHHQLRHLPLCLWPVTCRSFDGYLQEEGSYSSQDDFPLFGQRLAKLQQFNLRQQPSELWDLWRDRRNPLQWYTFWAVLVVGGVSITLSLAQLAVGIAQIIYS